MSSSATPDTDRLFLLDAYALIYRAYYALVRSPRVTSQGQNVSAVFGFCNTLDEILRKEDPTHIAVCFDPPGPTFRHEMYADYKAGRDKQPEDITMSIPLIKEVLRAYNIPIVECEGYEADDVIGTLSRMATAEGFTTYMMTPDKDYGQLVNDRVYMYRPALRGEGFEVRGPQQVCERYGISRPGQVADLLALEGDASDNIPGCPGIGPKTASKLIAEWDTVENLVSHAAELKGAVKTKIEQNARQILFSKDLALIRTDVPLPEGLTIGSLRRREADAGALLRVFEKLEFRTFIRRLRSRLSDAAGATSSAPAAAVASADGMQSLFDVAAEDTAAGGSLLGDGADYRLASTAAEALGMIADAMRCGAVGISLLSNGPTIMRSELLGVAVSSSAGKAGCILLPPGDEAEAERLRAAIEPLFGSGANRPVIVGHDIKRTCLLLGNHGMRLADNYFDTSVAHYLLEPEMQHAPRYLTAKYLGLEMSDMPKTPAGSVKEVPEQWWRQACELADAALRLYTPLLTAIRDEGMEPLLRDIELPLIKVLAEMERTGVRVDTDALAELSREYTSRLRQLELQVYELAGVEFNIGSPAQVGEILFERMKIDDKAKRTKKGAFSTTEEILSKYARRYPIVDLILRIRALRKLLATYIDALPRLVNPATGKIHTSYNQTVTATGRISSTDPNLQNIPIRTDDGSAIRRAFIADDGDLIMSADYSQIELRLIADFSGDPHMIGAFASGEDIHRATAAKIYHLPLAEVTDTERRKAKTANFGIIYGISAFGLSERLGIPRGEAKDLITSYMENYPDVKAYMDRMIDLARSQGYVTTITGRRRMLPDINSRNAGLRGFSERNAVNAPLQGSAADIIKKAMVEIYRRMSEAGMRSRMIMQVHDELIFNVKPDELATLQTMVADCMEHAYSGRVRLEVASGVGANWLEAH